MSNIESGTDSDKDNEALTDAVSVLRDMLTYAMTHPTRSVAIALIPEEGQPVCSYSENANGCTQIGALYVLASDLALAVKVQEDEVGEQRMDS